MARARKTVEVEAMLKWANETLAYDGHRQEFKAGVCTMIESLLREANCYNGFHYIRPDIYGDEYSRQYYALI